MSAIPTILTDRLRLRAFVEDDLDAWAAICADPEVARFTSGEPLDREAAWNGMALLNGHWLLRGYGLWALEERETGTGDAAARGSGEDRGTGTLVGRAGLWYPPGWPGIEIGWALGSQYWGRGLATEAARATLDWAWRELELDHLISVIAPDNVRSIRVAEAIGERFEREGEVRGRRARIYGIARPR